MADLADLVAAQVPPSLLPGLAGDDAPVSADTPTTNNTTLPIPSVTVQNEETSSSAGSSNDGASAEEFSNVSTGRTTPAAREPLSKGPLQIDWDAEITLPDAANISSNIVPASRPHIIVLTGVSGLLGRALLSRLLEDPSITEIICIAVRSLDKRLASNQLPSNTRIKYFPGDLESPRLGLSETDAVEIFSRADAVIHNGADTSHLKFYPEIKAANMGSTRELISFCIPRKVPIHYLSTVGVALFGNYKAFPEISAANHRPPIDGSHGYVAAKWASERLLEEVQDKHGVNVWIHRPSTLIREGADAEDAAAQTDWMNALVAYMRRTQAVPILKNLRGALDLVYVRNATESILTAVLENKPKVDGDASYLHQVGDLVIPLDRLSDFVHKDTEAKKVEELPVEEWTARAVELGLNRGVAALIDSMDDPGQPHYPRMLKSME
jgi:thioester reductase-like protein